MRKLLIFAFTLLCFTAAAKAEVGIGLIAGGGQDDNNITSAIPSLNYSFSENNGIAGLEVLQPLRFKRKSDIRH